MKAADVQLQDCLTTLSEPCLAMLQSPSYHPSAVCNWSVVIQGVMTKRILGLLWRTSLAALVPTGLDMTLCFADVLRDYALLSRSTDTRDIALDYVSQLVQELSGTEKALPSLRVLSHLIAHSNSHTVSHCIAVA